MPDHNQRGSRRFAGSIPTSLSIIILNRQKKTVPTPTGDAFITAGNDAQINIYSIHTLQKIMTCEASAAKNIVDGHNSSVYALKHHPNDIWNFISAGWDDTVHFWDRRESRSQRKIFGPHICGQARVWLFG